MASSPLRVLAGLALTAALAPAHALPPVSLDQLIEARDLVCEFYNTQDWATVAARLALGDRSDMLMVIENVRRNPATARVVTSLTAGRRSVQRYAGDTGVHFVEDRLESVVVTTLTGCDRWKRKRGRDVCARYSALNAWHFDTSVHADADRAFRRLGESSYRGVCEPWDPN